MNKCGHAAADEDRSRTQTGTLLRSRRTAADARAPYIALQETWASYFISPTETSRFRS